MVRERLYKGEHSGGWKQSRALEEPGTTKRKDGEREVSKKP